LKLVLEGSFFIVKVFGIEHRKTGMVFPFP